MTPQALVVHRGQGGGESSYPGGFEERAGSVALSLLPGGLIVYFSFEGGGYFAGSVAFIALLVTQILLVRVLFARHPFAGCSRRLAIVAALFAAYAAWTLCSALWSHALGRALVEFDRALLYLLLLLLFGCLPRSSWRMPLILRGLAGGSLFVCTVSLITRVLPHLWPVSPGVANNRLSYPLTYWNALGILAAIGILLMLGIASDPRERIAVRALASAGVPIAATTLFFTFSRGAIAALLIGFVVFVLIGYSRGMLGALLAIVPATALSLYVSYHANLLATLDPTTRAAVLQGRHVALVVGAAAFGAALLRVMAYPLENWAGRRATPMSVPARVRRAVAGGTLLSMLAVLVLAGTPAFLAREYQQTFRASSANPNDLRSRLTDLSNTARIEHWRVALKVFGTAPVIGAGAGTFEREWYQDRSRVFRSTPVVHAHSLYLQTMSDLGSVGLLLLASTVMAVLIALGGRLRGPNRVAYAALLSAALAWALHAGVDWDWEMPAVTAWVFTIGGIALASSGSPQRDLRMETWRRVPLAALCLVVAVTPALLMLSQSHLAVAADAFGRGDCAAAEAGARSSIDVLSVRPQAYQIVGYCKISDGRFRDAVVALRKAVQLEAGDWEYNFGLAIAQAYAGIDPRSAFASAERLNPGDPIEQPMAPVLRTRSRATWLVAAQRAYAATFASGRLTLH